MAHQLTGRFGITRTLECLSRLGHPYLEPSAAADGVKPRAHSYKNLLRNSSVLMCCQKSFSSSISGSSLATATAQHHKEHQVKLTESSKLPSHCQECGGYLRSTLGTKNKAHMAENIQMWGVTISPLAFCKAWCFTVIMFWLQTTQEGNDYGFCYLLEFSTRATEQLWLK